MGLFNLFRSGTDVAKLEREKDRVYNDIERIGEYKRRLLNELKAVDGEHKKLCYRLNDVNIKLDKLKKGSNKKSKRDL